jgi:hypothetical protein
MPLQFDKLRFSPNHKATPNPDKATSNWPELFFWTNGLMLLNWVQVVMERLPSLNVKAQERFWKGSMPSQFLDDLPWIAKFPPSQVIEYCLVRQSRDRAKTRLIIRASGDRENPKGADSAVALGDILMEEKRFIINEAAKSKSVAHSGLPGLIQKAAKRNDVRLFIRLGKKLQTKRRRVDVDWNRPGCDPVALFLADNWCEGRNYSSRLPALCFFSDQALADFCSAAFGRKLGSPSLDAIRQLRRRLRLKQTTNPKVKCTRIKDGEICFIAGK